MRDAFGSTFMFRLIIIFIVFYVSFATIAVSYAKVFRLKNAVIDMVEQNQYGYHNKNGNENIKNRIETFLSASAYDYSNNKSVSDRLEKLCNDSSNGTNDNKDNDYIDNGVCLEKISYSTSKTTNKFYYKVTLYMVIDFPIFTYDAIIPIGGNTSDYGDFSS